MLPFFDAAERTFQHLNSLWKDIDLRECNPRRLRYWRLRRSSQAVLSTYIGVRA
jgi:hypothetical protein